jgi:immune inhibitor A
MTRSLTIPAGAVMLHAKVRYDIELDWDYAYVVVSQDGGKSWISAPTNLSTSTNPNGQIFGNGITGSTGGKWVDLSANLSAFTGDVLVGFRYWTDGAATELGFSADEITIAGGPADGAEADAGWTFNGFRVTGGVETQAFFNAYTAEFRQYRGFDATLQTGPYNFGFLNTKPEWVEHFPYQDGLLISYWDTSYTDNNVGAHPGGGLILPIDAHPTMLKNANGANWRTRIQVYDATFGLEATDAITLHTNSKPSTHPSLPAVKVFDDTKDWYDESGSALQAGSANPPQTGTAIEVVGYSAQSSFMQVQVKPSK